MPRPPAWPWQTARFLPYAEAIGYTRLNNADAGGFVGPQNPAPGDNVTVTGPYFIDTQDGLIGAE